MLSSRALATLFCMLASLLILGACSGGGTPTSATETPPPFSTTAATATARSTVAATPTPASTPLPLQRLDQLALSVTDLPAGFAITASGPGGPELGSDVLASYQEEFQQRDVTSTQALQQTIVIIDLLGQYKDSASALSGLRAINVQNLNQLLGSVNLSAEAAAVPLIAEDSQGFHFTGDSNNVSVGGYLVVFHRGPIASLVLTAAVKGAESLQQTIDLAQKQAQKLSAAR